jgi:SGNH domain (fused to AT3 domains)
VKILLATGLVVALAAIAGVAASAAGPPPCFGAASRDPKHPCSNPALALAVTPLPDQVNQEPGVGCKTVTKDDEPGVCAFGAPKSKAKRTFALIGDSHVYHWRATLDVIGRLKKWRGLSIMQGGCYFSEAARSFGAGAKGPCTEWYESVLVYLAHHPEVSTIFVTQNAGTPVTPKPGKTSQQTKVAGFQSTWRKHLPKTIKHIVVIRDNPKSTPDAINCVKDAIAAGITTPPGPACAIAHRDGVLRDAAATAAKRLHSSRYQTIDLTHYFCSSQKCFPVIAGVLVNRDSFGHITLTFARTLVPYFLRKLRVLMTRW